MGAGGQEVNAVVTQQRLGGGFRGRTEFARNAHRGDLNEDVVLDLSITFGMNDNRTDTTAAGARRTILRRRRNPANFVSANIETRRNGVIALRHSTSLTKELSL
jgi:hypothetical protein